MANFTVSRLDNISLAGGGFFENNGTCAEHILVRADRLYRLYYAILYFGLVLGFPGNLLSAIVWLRRHVTDRNTSAIYLAALAINDLVFILSEGMDLLDVDCSRNMWICIPVLLQYSENGANIKRNTWSTAKRYILWIALSGKA